MASSSASGTARLDRAGWLRAFFPFFLVMGLIALASLAAESWMMAFMAGFYIVSGAFKLLDIRGFAAAYRRYDVVAKAAPGWGVIYPFVEIALGFAFLFWVLMLPSTMLALALSLIGLASAVNVVRSGADVPCACLGTGFNFPMSMVSVVENLAMALMAAAMLVFGM
jgi:hypothetical protein